MQSAVCSIRCGSAGTAFEITFVSKLVSLRRRVPSCLHLSLPPPSQCACSPFSPPSEPSEASLSTFRFSSETSENFEMASGTTLSSLFTSQTAVSTSTSTPAWVIPEESLAIFAADQLPDFYYNGYSQDEVDVVTLFLGKSPVSIFRALFPATDRRLCRRVRRRLHHRVYFKSTHCKAQTEKMQGELSKSQF